MRALNISRIIRPVLAAVLMLAALLPAYRSAGQGTSGTLPDPISSRDLKMYARRLGLSEGQQQAAAAFQEEYARAFRALREGEIEQYLQRVRKVQRAGGLPPRKDLEQFVSDIDRMTQLIRNLDHSFFDQVQMVLTDEQMSKLARVRQLRERVRYRSQMMDFVGMLDPGSRVDLSVVLDGVNLAPADHAAADAMLEGYERTLTTDSRRIFQATTRMFLDIFTKLEEAGFSEESMTKPETAQQMFQTMQAIWQEVSAKLMETARGISELNKRTAKAVADALPPAAGRAFRMAYYREAYPEAAALQHGPAAADFERALKLPDLDAELRQAIESQKAEFDRRLDQAMGDMMERIDESRRNSPFDFASQASREARASLQAEQTKWMTWAGEALAALHERLGPERVAQLRDLAMAEAPVAVGRRAGSGEPAPEAAIEVPSSPATRGPDRFLSAAISPEDLARYAARMDLSEDDRAVLELLHEAYLQRYREEVETPAARLVELQRGVWLAGTEGGAAAPAADAEQRVAEAFALRRQLMPRIREIDEQFFADVQAAIGDSAAGTRGEGGAGAAVDGAGPTGAAVAGALESLRLQRNRVVADAVAWWAGMGPGGSNEARLDLSLLVETLDVPESAREPVSRKLLEYERAAAAAARQRYDVLLALQEAMERVNARRSANQDESPFSAEVQSAWQDGSRRGGESTRVLLLLNRRTLDELAASLPPLAAEKLRAEYRRKAYPEVYADTQALHPLAERLLALDDLTADQRQRVQSALAEYRPSYESLCDQMAVIHATNAEFVWTSEPQDWQNYQDRQNRLEQLRFERDELNARARRQVRSALTSDQVARLGPGLAD
jgi:hypothetical protein